VVQFHYVFDCGSIFFILIEFVEEYSC